MLVTRCPRPTLTYDENMHKECQTCEILFSAQQNKEERFLCVNTFAHASACERACERACIQGEAQVQSNLKYRDRQFEIAAREEGRATWHYASHCRIRLPSAPKKQGHLVE